jgi:CubicO group peptidase (beta-lactamase class C family)
MKPMVHCGLKGIGYLLALAILICVIFIGDQARFLTRTYDPTDRGQIVSEINEPSALPAIEASRELIKGFKGENVTPGFSIAVGKNGQLLWAEADGYADLDANVPMTLDSQFDIGSTSKALTGTLVMRLVEKGVLNLDTDVRDYVPEWPEKAHPVTLRQLLSHQAGIRHYGFSYTPFNWRHPSFIGEGFWPDKFETSAGALTIFKDDALLFKPHEDFKYSTYGYTLISAAIEGATGMHFLDALERDISLRAGMASTGGDMGADNMPDRVTGYRPHIGIFDDRRLSRVPEAHHSYKWAGGGIASTPSDLVRFGNALIQGEIVSDAAFKEMTTVGTLSNGDKNPQNYALGWRTGRFNLKDVTNKDEDDREVVLVSHGGSPFAGQAMLLILPDEGVVVALAMNATVNRGSRATRPLAARIAALFASE